MNNSPLFGKSTAFLLVCISAMHFSSAQNLVGTYSGKGAPGFQNGDTASASFNGPFGMCRDKAGNLYIADSKNHVIRKVTPAGNVSTYAGKGLAGYKDTVAQYAMFKEPSDICVDDTGNIFVCDFYNHRIRKISAKGMVTTVAGSGVLGYLDGPAATARFNYPRGICVDKSGNIYVGDSWSHKIRKVSVNGTVSTYAGGTSSANVGGIGAYVDGPADSARFYTPCGLAIDKQGVIYVADAYNHRIRMISLTGKVSTLAGSDSTGQGRGGYADGTVTSARFNTPTEVIVDTAGNLYVGDTFGNRVRKISAEGMVTTVAGSGKAGLFNGFADSARFSYTRALALDAAKNKLYVVDYNNHCIRYILLDKNIGMEEDELPESSVLMYPNPAPGRAFIRLNDGLSAGSRLSVFNPLGEEVLNTLMQDDILELPLPPGIYFCRFITKENRTLSKKIVVL